MSYGVKLANGMQIPSINESTTLQALTGAIDQLGQSPLCLVHAYAEALEDDKVFSVKFDIKDGFWWLNHQGGEECHNRSVNLRDSSCLHLYRWGGLSRHPIFVQLLLQCSILICPLVCYSCISSSSMQSKELTSENSPIQQPIMLI